MFHGQSKIWENGKGKRGGVKIIPDKKKYAEKYRNPPQSHKKVGNNEEKSENLVKIKNKALKNFLKVGKSW